MANRLFSKNRIRGISFRHTRAPTGAAGRSGKILSRTEDGPTVSSGNFSAGFLWNGPSPEELRASAPAAFSKRDIHRLMGDYGRNELHTRVSEAVDQLVRLRQLAMSVRKFVPESEPDRHFLDGEGIDDSGVHPLAELNSEVSALQKLWKLRLELLEMIAMAQDSLRNLRSTPSRTPRRPEAESARRLK